jgi:hypothetical protein
MKKKDSVSLCPGAERIRRPVPEYAKCPKCGKEVEIWSDELGGECECGAHVSRNEAACFQWCEHAKECLGEEKYNKLMKELKEAKK